MSSFQNRIVQTAEVDPKELIANPANFRIHSITQKEALLSILSRIGWVQTVIVNRQTGRIVDGHLRVALAIERGEPTIPVSYVDLSPDEERLALTTFDAITALADYDADALAQLVNEVEADFDVDLSFLEDAGFPTFDGDDMADVQAAYADRATGNATGGADQPDTSDHGSVSGVDDTGSSATGSSTSGVVMHGAVKIEIPADVYDFIIENNLTDKLVSLDFWRKVAYGET